VRVTTKQGLSVKEVGHENCNRIYRVRMYLRTLWRVYDFRGGALMQMHDDDQRIAALRVKQIRDEIAALQRNIDSAPTGVRSSSWSCDIEMWAYDIRELRKELAKLEEEL
jgi:hypothetical protein